MEIFYQCRKSPHSLHGYQEEESYINFIMYKLLPSAGNVFTHHIPMCHECILREDRAAVGTGGVVGCFKAIVGCCLGWGGGGGWEYGVFFLLENEFDI